jgi:ribonuclease HII
MRFGADEAGRGPVLGPLVVGAVWADPEDLPDGVADSKTLSAERRDALANEMTGDDRIATATATVSPARIDDPATDMNTLTVVAQAEAIGGVLADDDVDPDRAPSGVVDACDVDAERFAERVSGAITIPVDLRAEHRADEAHPIVAAASVIAKVERDRRIAVLDETHHAIPIGSGYPSDPQTRTFLAEYVSAHGELPDCARASWRTSNDVLRAAEQSALGDF